jgi:hypothetical protein
MKVRMYRNYDKFKSGGFNGRMIFTFFRPISRAFDCILVELPEGYKPLPLEKYEHYSGWQMELDQVVKKEEDGMYNTRGLTMRFFDEKNWDYVNVPKGWLDTYAKEDTVPPLCGRENIPIKFIRIEYSTVKELTEKFNCEYVEPTDEFYASFRKRINEYISAYEKWKDVKEEVNRRSVTTFETLKERVELKSNWHEKTYIGNPGDYVLNVGEKRYLILGVIAAEDTPPSSDHMFFHVQSFNSKDQETRLPAFGLPENTPPAIIEMIEKEATRRDELISSHGEEDWG